MRRALALLLPSSLLACGGSAPADGLDPTAIRGGLWETTGRVGEMSGLGLSEAAVADLRRALGNPRPERACFPGGTPKVGGPFLGGRCAYTRVADRGDRADRSVSCPPSKGAAETIEITGTLAPDRYSLRILSRRTDSATGRTLQAVETFEEGRRLGPCPEGGE